MDMRIPFNVPTYTGDEEKYIHDAILNHKICGDGKYTKLCNEWMETTFNAKRIMLTTSGTSALDMAVMLCDLKPGDEVILPSYTFSSSANAILLSGGVPVFVDIRPDTMNIDESKIEDAITDKTKAIMVVHYGGVACEMDAIMDIGRRHSLRVIEDAAQAFMSQYEGRHLGTIGDFGCYSFHETKNLTMGEGGAIVINDETAIEKAEIIREKGTDRSKFYRGQIDKYTWVDAGDSYLPSELNAAYLYAQLLQAKEITEHRVNCWAVYHREMQSLADRGDIGIPYVPHGCVHNGHMFYIKTDSEQTRARLITYLKEHDIGSVFHYIPLHSAPAGIKFARFHGTDVYTTREAMRLLRLPMHCELREEDAVRVIDTIEEFLRR